MKLAAIGARLHSGWGSLVAVSVCEGRTEVLERRRITVIEPAMMGATQPYHFAKNLELSEAEEFLGECLIISERLAAVAVRRLLDDLHARPCCVVGCAVLLGSGRLLPALSNIFASHPLLHTAEGEFFRRAFRKGCESLELPVTGIKEKKLEEVAKAAFGDDATQRLNDVSGLGRYIGPPWTKDQKTAALAASILLAGRMMQSDSDVRVE